MSDLATESKSGKRNPIVPNPMLMKLKLYTLLFLLLYVTGAVTAQTCTSLTATAVSFESRCASTGKIIITVSNGSGTYNYSVTGPVSTPYTSSNEINGLPAGAYTISVKDVINDCIYTLPQPVIVEGDYQDPRFDLVKSNVTCINGTDGTIRVENVLYGREPFVYTIVAPSSSAIGTTSTTGQFTGLPPGNYFIQQRDSCGGIQTRSITILNYDWSITPYSVIRTNCDSADVFIGLRDIFGKTNTADSVFNGFTYGIVTPDGDTILSSDYNFRIRLGDFRSLRIFVTDRCGNTKRVTWTDNRIPRVANAVAITDPTCFDFSALITGQQNLTNPEYCLYDSSNNLLACNTTGSFPNLAWGSYCIRITDACFDTVITRCFNAVKPVPSVAANVTVSYGDDCRIVTVSVSGQTNLFNPVFCLYDSSDVLITCNNTGVFSNIPVGRYCMRITGSICNDTTLIRCFEVVPLPVGPGTGPSFSNYSCSTFTGTISGTVGLGNATYCLYDSIGQLIRCNQTGVFDSLAYGSYCVNVQVSTAAGGCADTSFNRCFTVTKPVPSLGPVTINKNCKSFSLQLSSYQNLFNPDFCLYKDSKLIDCNTTGIFTDLPYGTYCLTAKDSCSDTTLQRCFDVTPDTLQVRASAVPSCTIGRTAIRVTIDQGLAPYTVTLFKDSNTVVTTVVTNNRTISFDTLQQLPLQQSYRIVITDSCGNTTELITEPVLSQLNKSRRIIANCPGGTYPNGSSDIELTVQSNLGRLLPRIIRKNGVSVNINYTFSNTGQTIFTFKNMEPGTYIIRSRMTSPCSITVFDTITVTPYVYPTLQNSSLYRCDDNSFNIAAVTNGGINPFSYEITGSIPPSPSIVSASPQSSPNFTINNGTAYSLVRLRVLDACGNASINDISTVPLVNLVVSSVGGCYNSDVTLLVDPIAGASYEWYKRIPPGDSVLVGTSPSFYIPTITQADTGLYFCKVVLNSGCITRIAKYYVDGLCGGLLPDNPFKLTSVRKDKHVELNWTIKNEDEIKTYSTEVKRPGALHFENIHTKTILQPQGYYTLKDVNARNGINTYRIKAVYETGQIVYSNLSSVLYKETGATYYAYPNPAKERITIKVPPQEQVSYRLRLFDVHQKQVLEVRKEAAGQLQVQRPPSLQPGVYFLYLMDEKNKTTEVLKIIFQ